MKTALLLILATAAHAKTKKVKTAQELYDAVEANDDVKIMNDIDLPDEGPEVVINGKIKVDGNGYTLRHTIHSFFVVADGAELKLEDATLETDMGGDDGDDAAEGCVTVESGGFFEAVKVKFDGCLSKREGYGGGVTALPGSAGIEIKKCDFQRCVTEEGEGGGIHSEADVTLIEKTDFTENSADGYGAALYISRTGGEAGLKDCEFHDNVASRSTIYFSGLSDLVVDKMEVYSEQSRGGGGVLVASQLSEALFSDSEFHDLDERAVRMFLLYQGPGVVFRDCTFESIKDSTPKASSPGGAAIFVKEAPHSMITIQGCTFKDCVSEYDDDELNSQGGALWLGADATITDTQFKECKADEGGAAFVAAPVRTVSFESTVFEGNVANVAGGAVAVATSSSPYFFTGCAWFTNVVGTENVCASSETSTKEGGDFLKQNGGELTMNDAQLLTSDPGDGPFSSDDVHLNFVEAKIEKSGEDTIGTYRVTCFRNARVTLKGADTVQVTAQDEDGETFELDEGNKCYPGSGCFKLKVKN